jgi:hypothetical protein
MSFINPFLDYFKKINFFKTKMNYINFSTNFKIINDIGYIYLNIYSLYMGCKNYYNFLHNPNEIIPSPNLKQLFNNKDSDKTLNLLNNSETEIYDFINDFTDLLYQISQHLLNNEITESQILFLHFCKHAFFQAYLNILTYHNSSIVQYGNPFYNLLSDYNEIQECLLTIYHNLNDECNCKNYKIDNFVNLLIELKLLPIIFTQMKNKILDENIIKPTPI